MVVISMLDARHLRPPQAAILFADHKDPAMKQLIVWLLVLHGTVALAQWQETNYAENMSVEDISFVNEDVGYVVGYHEVYKTVNGGDSWILSVANIFDNGPRLVHFIDQNVGFIAGSSGGIIDPIHVAKTINGGFSWNVTELAGNDQTFSYGHDLFFFDANTGFLACNGGSVYRTTDQGANWERVYNEPGKDFSAIHFPTAAIGYMVPVSGNVIYRTINGGNTWSTMPLGGSYGMTDVLFLDSQTGFITCSYSRILKTTDGGLTWTETDFGTQDAFNAIAFTNSNTGYVVGSNGTMVTTSNGGDTWTPQASGVSHHLTCIDFVNESVGYIGTASYGRVLKTTNGGGILAIEDLEANAPFSVYPNPSGGILYVTFDEALTDPVPYHIATLTGSVVQTGTLYAQHAQLEVSGLPAGVYLLTADAYPTGAFRLIIE